MIFRTQITPDSSDYPHKLDYKTKSLWIGSCFSTNMGKRMQEYCFPVVVNPFGVVYNPMSLANSLNFLIKKHEFKPEDLFYNNDLWHSFHFHSSFSSPKKEEYLNKINNECINASLFIAKCDFLFITFGTAYVYTLKRNGEVVNNCHKLPSKEFSRDLLSINEITDIYNKLIADLRNINSSIKIVFSVSPIRHLRDGAHENQISKSVLLLAVNELVNKHSDCFYFPSYEILLDDLRDYRFYAQDMCHPSIIAEEYIWEKFTHSLISSETQNIMKEVASIIKAKQHRPFNPESENYRIFTKKIEEKIRKIEEKLKIPIFSHNKK